MQAMGGNVKQLCDRRSLGNIEIPALPILVIQNSSEIHEPWHAIMERNQDAGVKKFVSFGPHYGISFSQTRASQKKPHGFR